MAMTIDPRLASAPARSRVIGTEALGVLLVTASAFAFSTAGLFSGLVHADTSTMLFWRGIFGGLFIGAYVCWHERGGTLRAFRAVGRAGMVAASCSTLATICFLQALRHTTVADVAVVFAATPFMAAAIAWLWLRERPRKTTLAASLAALLGVLFMFDASLEPRQLAGNLLALAMSILIATMMVVIRHNRQVSMLPASCLSAFGCSVLVAPFAAPFSVSGIDWLWLVLFGTTQFGLGLLLLTIGSRLISAPQGALISNLELPLGPFWVWLAFGQMASRSTLIGGAVVMLAVLLDFAAGQRRAPTTHGD
jgi:drug/metabolite transporter (DMT)-like permease